MGPGGEDETDADRHQRLEDMVNTMLVNDVGTEESRVVITTLSPGHFSVRLPAGEKRRRTTAAVGLQTEAQADEAATAAAEEGEGWPAVVGLLGRNAEWPAGAAPGWPQPAGELEPASREEEPPAPLAAWEGNGLWGGAKAERRRGSAPEGAEAAHQLLRSTRAQAGARILGSEAGGQAWAAAAAVADRLSISPEELTAVAAAAAAEVAAAAAAAEEVLVVESREPE